MELPESILASPESGGENSLKHAGEHQNLVSFPHLCSLSPAQGYRAGFSASGFHLDVCLLAHPSGLGCPEVPWSSLPQPFFLLSHKKPPATLLWSPHIILSSSYDLPWAAFLSASTSVMLPKPGIYILYSLPHGQTQILLTIGVKVSTLCPWLHEFLEAHEKREMKKRRNLSPTTLYFKSTIIKNPNSQNSSKPVVGLFGL